MSDQIKAWAHCGGGDIDMELDRADLGPALAAPESHPGSQERWANGSKDDREGDPGTDDREPDVDSEPGADAEPRFGWNDEEAAWQLSQLYGS